MENDMRCEKKTIVCRRAVSNAKQAQALFERITTSPKAKDYRAIVVIESTVPDELPQWREWIVECFAKDILYFDDNQVRDRSDELARILGSEQNIAVYAREFDAGLFAAVAGSITQSGILIWLTKPLEEWAQESRYGGRVVRLLEEIPDDDFTAAGDGQSGSARQEQDEMLGALLDICTAEDAAVAVVEGKRGRGKSTLLGRLAKQLGTDGINVLTTASYRGAIQNVSKAADGYELRYVAADQALGQSAQVLLVDEAANIPIRQLQSWVSHFPKVVLATTVEGYESAGRSFTIRFAQWLDENHPRWFRFEPLQAWRWRTDDSLEWFVDKLLLSSPPQLLPYPDDLVETPIFLEITQQELASNENLLASVFELFRVNHYQTSVLDVKHLLDASNIRVFAISVSNHVVAAAQVAIEGELDNSLHDAIVARRRRVAHQLLPQLLAQTANQSTALTARYARVLRIAVAPTWRRRKLASRLLQFVEKTLSDSIDIMGASFADTESAKAFWQHNGYPIVHQGFRINPRSGVRSLLVLKAFDTAYADLLRNVNRLYLENHRVGDVKVVDEIDDPHLSDHALLARLAQGERHVHDTLAALRRLLGEPSENANWLEQLYTRLGCTKDESQGQREKKLRHWLRLQTTTRNAP